MKCYRNQALSVAISDPHPVLRESHRQNILSVYALSSVQEADNGYATLRLCKQNRPDLIILDFGISGPSGKEVMTKLQRTDPRTKVIAIANDNLEANMYFALSNGAVAFLPKHSRTEDFMNAIAAALSGFTYFPRECVEILMANRLRVARTGNLFGLSPREMEVLKISKDIPSTKEVAALLNISARTVESHRNNIYRKTNCDDLSEIMSMILGGDAQVQTSYSQ